MHETHDAHTVSDSAQKNGLNPQDAPLDEDLTWLRIQYDRFKARSAAAVAPEDVPAYAQQRGREWPSSIRAHGLYDEKERAAYHRARQATRGHEAISPGEAHDVPALRFVEVRRHEPKTRPFPAGAFQQRVFDPRRKGEPGYSGEYTIPNPWTRKQFFCVPRSVMYTTSLSTSEKTVLAILHDSVSAWDRHVRGKLEVKGVTQAQLASITSLSIGQISRITDSLDGKDFLTKARDPDEDNDCNRRIYYLTAIEKAHWTYPALSNQSARARLKALWHQYNGRAPVEWDRIRHEKVRRFTKASSSSTQDAAARKLDQDQRRRRTAETGLHSGFASAGSAADPEVFEQLRREAAQEQRQQRARGRPPDPPPGADGCG